jgi:hypothetical protein
MMTRNSIEDPNLDARGLHLTTTATVACPVHCCFPVRLQTISDGIRLRHVVLTGRERQGRTVYLWPLEQRIIQRCFRELEQLDSGKERILTGESVRLV